MLSLLSLSSQLSLGCHTAFSILCYCHYLMPVYVAPTDISCFTSWLYSCLSNFRLYKVVYKWGQSHVIAEKKFRDEGHWVRFAFFILTWVTPSGLNYFFDILRVVSVAELCLLVCIMLPLVSGSVGKAAFLNCVTCVNASYILFSLLDNFI